MLTRRQKVALWSVLLSICRSLLSAAGCYARRPRLTLVVAAAALAAVVGVSIGVRTGSASPASGPTQIRTSCRAPLPSNGTAGKTSASAP